MLSYQVSPIDKKHMMRGLLESMRIHAASGAIRIYSPHTEPLIWRQGMDLDKYLGSVEDKGLGPNQSSTFSAHQLGTCRIAGDPSLGAVKPNGETYEVEGLYVADGSVFPTSCGVNPMIPISATSYFLAGRIARKLA